MSRTATIHEFLHAARVPYTVVPHLPAFSAQEGAAAIHVHGRHWAKVIALFVDEAPIEAVIPAPMTVDLGQLLELSGGHDIRLAREEELATLFPGCEPGAMPPFGPLYGQAVYVDVSLAAQHEIVFNAGSHSEAIAMRWADFVRSIRPIVGAFATAPHDTVGAFRLSYRE